MFRTTLLIAVTFILTGCQGNPDHQTTIPVTGVVTYKNAPVTSGTITFHPVAAEGNPAVSLIDDQGKFQLTTYSKGDGAVAGFHNVTIVVSPRLDGTNTGEADVIPPAYNRAETTPLSLEVLPQGNNHFEIVLKEN